MPKRTKKLLIYLDQNFISEIAKVDTNQRVKSEFKTLYQLLAEGFVKERLVVPQSWFHDVETSLAPALKERIVKYQNHVGQADLQHPNHVRNFQIGRYLQQFLGEDQDPLDPEIAFRDDPDQRVQMFKISVNMHWERWDYRSPRLRTQAQMEDIRREIVANKVSYDDQLERELSAQKKFYLTNAMAYHGHLCKDPRKELVLFTNDPMFRTIPVVSIYSRLWSALFTKNPTRQIRSGDATDIDVLSTYLPYMDVIATDAFMAAQLQMLAIDREHDITLFTGKTSSLEAFLTFLQDYIKNSEPANRPVLSVFVLPSPSVKERAAHLFFAIAAAARQFRDPQWVDVYGFNDGRMPDYMYRNIKMPFYGLQEVHEIKLEPGTTMEDILRLCRARCKSDYFVVINEYRDIPKHFLRAAMTEIKAGRHTIDGYQIFNTAG